MSTVLKKGGQARYTLESAVNGSSFILPAGFSIKNITVESLDAVGGTLDVGVADFPTKEIVTFPVDAVTNALDGVESVETLVVTGAPTATGHVTVTVNGVAVEIALDHTTDTTPELVAAAIAAGSWTGYTAAQGVGANDHKVIFTATAIGPKIGALTFVDTDTTGAVATISNTTAGLSVANDHGTVTITLNDVAKTVEIYGSDTTAALVATRIANASYPGWTTAVVDNTNVVFTSRLEGALTGANTFDDTDSVGITVGTITQTEGKSYHINETFVANHTLSGTPGTVEECTLAKNVESMTTENEVIFSLNSASVFNAFVELEQLD